MYFNFISDLIVSSKFTFLKLHFIYLTLYLKRTAGVVANVYHIIVSLHENEL